MALKRASVLIMSLIATMTLAGCVQQPAEIPNTEVPEVEAVKIVTKPKELVVDEINELLRGDSDTIVKYFGKSDVYTSDAVKDRVSVAKVTFVDIESDIKNEVETKDLDEIEVSGNGTVVVTLHICTMDYNKTKEAVDSLTERMKTENPTMSQEEMNNKVTNEIASRAQNGEFEVHITLPLNIEVKTNSEAKVEITEAFKAAITGGWYNPTGAKLISGDCPLREAAQVEANKAAQETPETGQAE